MDTKNIEKTLCDFLEEVAKQGIRHPRDIECIAKAVYALEGLQGLGGEEYSYNSRNSYNSYDGGGSYEGGTSTRRGMRGRSRNSYDGGYSGHNITGMLREKLEEVMETADSEMDRQKVRSLMERL